MSDAVKQTGENGIGKGKAGPGRPKGSANKTTKALKEMILTALDEAHEDGGIAYLKAQASANPTAFLTLVGKVLPLQVGGDPANPLQHIHSIELVGVAAARGRHESFSSDGVNAALAAIDREMRG